MMDKRTPLKIVNPVLGVLLVNQAATGMLHDVLPHEVFCCLAGTVQPGPRAGGGNGNDGRGRRQRFAILGKGMLGAMR
ncbi:hypothetical protein ACFLSJ_07050 [Verrucomicrobiota bacterium]